MFKRIGVYALIAGINKSFTIVIVPILLIGFSSDEVGKFTVFILFCTLLSPVTSLNLATVILQSKITELYNSPKFIPFFIFQATLLFCLVTTTSLNLKIFIRDYDLVLFTAGALTESLFLCALALARIYERVITYAALGIGKISFFLFFSFLGERLNMSLEWLYMVSNLVFAILPFSIFLFKSLYLNLPGKVFYNNESIKFGVGLFGYQISQWVANSGTRVVVGFLLGARLVTDFSLALMGALPLLLLNSGLIIFLPPLLVNNYEEHVISRTDLRIYIFLLTGFIASFLGVMLWCFFAQNYFTSLPRLNFFTVAICCLAYFNYSIYLIFANYLFYYRAVLILSRIGGINAVFSIIISVLCVSFCGVNGAAIAMWANSILYVFQASISAEKFEPRLTLIRKKVLYLLGLQFFLLSLILLNWIGNL